MDEFQFTAHIENLGKRTCNTPVGAYLSFPTTTEAVQRCLASIGVDGLRYEEIIITDYSITIPGLQPVLGEYAHLDELNYLAGRIQNMTPEQRMVFMAAVKHGEYSTSLEDVINLTYNLDCYDLLPEVKTYEDYGRHLVDVQRDFALPEKVGFYFDYAAYGEDTTINEGGSLTPYGYICNNQSPFQAVYGGKTVPTEYRVFQYPMQAKARQGQQKPPAKPPTR